MQEVTKSDEKRRKKEKDKLEADVSEQWLYAQTDY